MMMTITTYKYFLIVFVKAITTNNYLQIHLQYPTYLVFIVPDDEIRKNPLNDFSFILCTLLTIFLFDYFIISY